MKNKNHFLVFGQLSPAVGLALSFFFKDRPPVSFAIGLLIGLSIVFNIFYLLDRRKERQVNPVKPD